MKKEDTEMMLRIFETERAGYAYLYPSDGGERKEDYICLLYTSIIMWCFGNWWNNRKCN